MNISNIKGDTAYTYIFRQDLGNFIYSRRLDSTKAMKRRSHLGDGKKGDLVEAMLGLGWIYAETKVEELDLVKKMVPYIEQILMEYGYEKDREETEAMTEEEKEIEEGPISRKEAMA
eukprot:26732-Heterocapsa_arctica.AAC.1